MKPNIILLSYTFLLFYPLLTEDQSVKTLLLGVQWDPKWGLDFWGVRVMVTHSHWYIVLVATGVGAGKEERAFISMLGNISI